MIVFHFVVRLLVQFADILLPFFMALILVTVLDPIKAIILSVLEGLCILTLLKMPACACCLRLPKRKETLTEPVSSQKLRKKTKEKNETLTEPMSSQKLRKKRKQKKKGDPY